MKQVKNYHSKKGGIVNFNLTVYHHISNGLNPSKIAKKYNLPISNITYYTKKLEQDGLIKKVGYGTWETTNKQVKNYYKDGRQNLHLSKDVRGHGFQFKLVIKNDLVNWKKRVEFLTKNNINYSLVGNKGSIIRIIYKKHKIWLCNKSIIVYYPQDMSFFGRSAKKSRTDAIHDFHSIIKSLERYLHADFKIRGKYLFKITKHHYALVRSDFASYYLKQGKKLEVRTDEGELWLLIDNSHNLKETETVHPETADKDMDKPIKPFLNSLRSVPFTAYDIQGIIGGLDTLTKIQAIESTKWGVYAGHIDNHTKAIIKLGELIDQLSKQLKRMEEK